MNSLKIPLFVKPFLWSYDTDKLNLKADQERIITNVLNLGDDQSVRWLLATYPRSVIESVIRRPRIGEWNRKSLHFWSLIFNTPSNYSSTRLS